MLVRWGVAQLAALYLHGVCLTLVRLCRVADQCVWTSRGPRIGGPEPGICCSAALSDLRRGLSARCRDPRLITRTTSCAGPANRLVDCAMHGNQERDDKQAAGHPRSVPRHRAVRDRQPAVLQLPGRRCFVSMDVRIEPGWLASAPGRGVLPNAPRSGRRWSFAIADDFRLL